MKKNLLPIVIVAILVAGAAYFFMQRSAPHDQNTPPIPPGSTIGTKPTAPTTKPTGDGTPTAPSTTPSVIDETWTSYTNTSGEFTFKTPTKGRYAPTWETSYSNEGCTAEAKTLEVNGVSFCHDSMVEGAAGSAYFTDTFKTKSGDRYIQISFLKHVVNGGMMDCHFPPEHPYSTSGTTCINFDEAAYQVLLEQIMGTFMFTATP